MNPKPLVIRIKEAEKALLDSINKVMQEQELPCYIIEPIIEKLHDKVSRSAQAEYEQAISQLKTTGGEENERDRV